MNNKRNRLVEFYIVWKDILGVQKWHLIVILENSILVNN